MLEDTGAQSITGWATDISAGPANEAGQALSFLVSSDNPALFSAQPAVSPTGTLTYDPAPNANGSATVSVRIQDNGGTANGGVDTSAPQAFTHLGQPAQRRAVVHAGRQSDRERRRRSADGPLLGNEPQRGPG